MSQVNRYNQTGKNIQGHGVNNEPAFEIMDLFYALFRWRWFVIFFTIISAILSFLAASARDLEYQAVTSILINPLGINVIEGDINTRTESPDVNIALIESQMRIMESRPVIRQTIKNLANPDWPASGGVVDLLDDPELNGNAFGLKTKLLSLFGLSVEESSKDDSELSVMATMRGNIAVYRPQLGYVVELNYKSNDARKSALIANAIAQTYLELDNESNAQQAKKAADDLGKQLENLRDELRRAEIAVENHKRDKGIINAAGGLANELEFTQVQQDLIEARNKAAAAKITLETVNALKESGTLPQNLPEAIRSTSVANLRAQLSQVKQRQITLSAQYLPTHPVMRAAELAVEDAENSVQSEIALIAEAAQLEYNNALRTENELKQEVGSLTNASFTTNDDLIKLRDLQRDADAKKVVFESFLLRAGQLGQQADVDTNEAKIVSQASEPQEPIDLPGTLLMAGGTIFGFVLSCVIVLVGTGVATLGRTMSNYGEKQTNKRESRFKTNGGNSNKKAKNVSENVENKKQVRRRGSLLGNIFKPDDNSGEEVEKSKAHKRKKATAEKPRKSRKKQNNQSLNLPVLHALEVNRGYMIGQTIPFLEDANLGERMSDLVEEIISFSSGARTRIVLVTGFQDSYGKSTAASNMAFAAYQLGFDCACIGMDTENKQTLSEFAQAVNDEMQIASSVKVAGGRNNAEFAGGVFKYLGIKHMDKDNAFQADIELLKLKEYLTSNEKHYDIVFIDGPLLDEKNQLEKVAEMADEVIITMPKKLTGKIKSSTFAKLGSRNKRIRGLITTQYYTS